jgi:hypothetical protein
MLTFSVSESRLRSRAAAGVGMAAVCVVGSSAGLFDAIVDMAGRLAGCVSYDPARVACPIGISETAVVASGRMDTGGCRCGAAMAARANA